MSSLLQKKELRKASTDDLIDTIRSISNFIEERESNNPDYDQDQVIKNLLGDDCYNHPSSISAPFVVNNAVIALPSLKPLIDSSGNRRNCKSVIPVVQLPRKEPYVAYDDSCPSFIEKAEVSLRGGRSIMLHKAFPGMIVSFHHYKYSNGNGERYRIDALRLVYNDDNEIDFERLPEGFALFPIPALRGAAGNSF